MKIYLSSTSRDLTDYRKAVIDAIRRMDSSLHIVCMENYTADGERPAQKCIDDVAGCDLYIGLFAWRYGSIDPIRDKSITELEYRSALEKKLPCLIFLVDEDTPWLPKYTDRGEAGERLHQLKTELQGRHIVDTFTSPDHLASQVATTLAKHLEEGPELSGGEDFYEELTDLYLDHLIARYAKLDMQGIYEAGQLRSIDLEKVYVALRAEERSIFDRVQLDELHQIELREELDVESLEQLSDEELLAADALLVKSRYKLRDQRAETTPKEKRDSKRVLNLGDIFRQEKWSVILGKPGSGKSTLVKWISLKLARSLKASRRSAAGASSQRVLVPQNTVDPDGDAEIEVDLGPVRLPILIRISDYARAYELSPVPLTLAAYLGQQVELTNVLLSNNRRISLGDLNGFLLNQLQEGKAVVLLDGLDEILQNRKDIIQQVQDFIVTWINQEGKTGSDFMARALAQAPWEAGGNQIIVTSRPVGYYSAAIKYDMAHFSIQDMERPAVEHFCQTWTHALYEVLVPKGTREEVIDRRARTEAKALIAAIYDDDRPHLRKLATNPLLVTIIATVFRYNKGRLPAQRAELYDRAIDNLLNIWLDRPECKAIGLKKKEVLDALIELAAEIHSTQSNGLIYISDLKEVFSRVLAKRRKIDEDHPLFQESIDVFLETVRRNIGIIAEESQRNYKFIHRTFQEYLAARHLLAKKSKASKRIAEKIDDPIWREPIALALSYVGFSDDWGTKSRTNFFRDFLRTEDPLRSIIPRSALLLAGALAEARNMPDSIIEEIMEQLFKVLTDVERMQQLPTIREQVMLGWQRIYASPYQPQLIDFLVRTATKEQDAAVVAELAMGLDYIDTDLIITLLAKADYDSDELGFPIDRLLFKVLCQQQNDEEFGAGRITLERVWPYLPMRQALATDEKLLEKVRSDIRWLGVFNLLYGGFEQYGILTEINHRAKAKYEYNADLSSFNPDDIDQDSLLYQQLKATASFSVNNIYREASITKAILRTLRGQQPMVVLLEEMEEIVGGTQPIARRWEATVVLSFFRFDLSKLETFIGGEQRNWMVLIGRARRALVALEEPIMRVKSSYTGAVPDSLSEESQFKRLRSLLPHLLALGVGGLRISGIDPNWGGVTHRDEDQNNVYQLDRENAEYFHYLCASGASDHSDITYTAAVVLDTIGKRVKHDPHRNIATLAAVHEAGNRFTKYAFPWALNPLPPYYDNSTNRARLAIEAVAFSPAKTRFFTMDVLHSCVDKLIGNDADRPFIIEALAFLVNESRENTYISTAARRTYHNYLRTHLNTIGDPFTTFRSLYWLYLGTELVIPVNLSLLYAAFERIGDPHDKIWATEMLLTQLLVWDENDDLLTEAIELLPRVKDAENRVRASIRLSLFVRGLKRAELQMEAIEWVREITPSERQVATIRGIGECEHIVPAVRLRLDELARTHLALHHYQEANSILFAQLIETWQNFNPTVTSGKRKQGGKLEWSLMFSYSFLIEVLRQIEFRQGQIATSTFRSGLIAHAPDEAVSTEENWSRWLRELDATSAEKQSMYEIETSSIHDIGLPHLRAQLTSGKGLVSSLAALKLGESEYFTAAMIPPLIRLCNVEIDKLRYRAAIVLNSAQPNSGNKERKIVLSRAGLEVFEAIGEEIKLLYETNLRHGVNVGWTRHNLLYDDATVVDSWLWEAPAEKGRAKMIKVLIESIEKASDAVFTVLLRFVEEGDGPLRKSCLKALCRIIYAQRKDISKLNTLNFYKLVGNHLIPAEVLMSLSHIPRGAVNVLNSAAKSLEDTPHSSLVELIEKSHKYLEEKRVSLADLREPDLDELEEDDLKEACEKIKQGIIKQGSSAYVNVGEYWKSAEKEAEKHRENKPLLELLIAWLVDESGNEDIDDPLLGNVLASLNGLCIASPTAFATVASPEELEPILVRLAQHLSWTVRVSAFKLIGHLRYVSTGIAQALTVGTNDILYVQQAVHTTIEQIRRVNGDIIGPLIQQLKSTSNYRVHSTIELLTVIGQMESTAVEDRKKILSQLAELFDDQGRKRKVYTLGTDGEGMIQIGELNDTLLRAIVLISRLV